MLAVPPPPPPKAISVRWRGPLIYTVLSVVCPITVVRVLIFRSATANVERKSAATSDRREKRITGSLLRLANSTRYQASSSVGCSESRCLLGYSGSGTKCRNSPGSPKQHESNATFDG